MENKYVKIIFIKCAFAHGKHEVRQKVHVPHNYKTQICKNYTKDGYL